MQGQKTSSRQEVYAEEVAPKEVDGFTTLFTHEHLRSGVAKGACTALKSNLQPFACLSKIVMQHWTVCIASISVWIECCSKGVTGRT